MFVCLFVCFIVCLFDFVCLVLIVSVSVCFHIFEFLLSVFLCVGVRVCLFVCLCV